MKSNVTRLRHGTVTYGFTVTTLPLPDTMVHKMPKAVMIDGEWRGGSSFLGEIFNQNKQALYLFEPDSMIHGLGENFTELNTYITIKN